MQLCLLKTHKILEFNQCQIPDKAPFLNYGDPECIIEKIDGGKNNPENLSTTKVSKHIPTGFAMSTRSPFRSIEKKHDVYRGKGFLKKFCEFLTQQAMEIINFRNKKNKIIN